MQWDVGYGLPSDGRRGNRHIQPNALQRRVDGALNVDAPRGEGPTHTGAVAVCRAPEVGQLVGVGEERIGEGEGEV